jgi:hypothetical protein
MNCTRCSGDPPGPPELTRWRNTSISVCNAVAALDGDAVAVSVSTVPCRGDRRTRTTAAHTTIAKRVPSRRHQEADVVGDSSTAARSPAHAVGERLPHNRRSTQSGGNWRNIFLRAPKPAPHRRSPGSLTRRGFLLDRPRHVCGRGFYPRLKITWTAAVPAGVCPDPVLGATHDARQKRGTGRAGTACRAARLSRQQHSSPTLIATRCAGSTTRSFRGLERRSAGSSRPSRAPLSRCSSCQRR